MDIRSGDFEVLSSGVVMSYGRSDIDFELAKGMVVSVRMAHVDGENPSIEVKHETEKLVFVFTNPEIINYGSAEPLELGTLGGRALHANLRVSVFGKFSSFQVTYTFYLAREKA